MIFGGRSKLVFQLDTNLETSVSYVSNNDYTGQFAKEGANLSPAEQNCENERHAAHLRDGSNRIDII